MGTCCGKDIKDGKVDIHQLEPMQSLKDREEINEKASKVPLESKNEEQIFIEKSKKIKSPKEEVNVYFIIINK